MTSPMPRSWTLCIASWSFAFVLYVHHGVVILSLLFGKIKQQRMIARELALTADPFRVNISIGSPLLPEKRQSPSPSATKAVEPSSGTTLGSVSDKCLSKDPTSPQSPVSPQPPVSRQPPVSSQPPEHVEPPRSPEKKGSIASPLSLVGLDSPNPKMKTVKGEEDKESPTGRGTLIRPGGASKWQSNKIGIRKQGSTVILALPLKVEIVGVEDYVQEDVIHAVG